MRNVRSGGGDVFLGELTRTLYCPAESVRLRCVFRRMPACVRSTRAAAVRGQGNPRRPVITLRLMAGRAKMEPRDLARSGPVEK